MVFQALGRKRKGNEILGGLLEKTKVYVVNGGENKGLGLAEKRRVRTLKAWILGEEFCVLLRNRVTLLK